ncbi:hypothetical protein ES703_102540 [subsurface metagenome]
MKQYLMPILAAILVLILVPLIGCGESERDKAVTFYQGAYPIGKEMKQVGDDWNTFLNQFSQRKVTNQEILERSQEYATRLEALPQDLSMLYAPPPLRQLKDDMASALNLGIEAFTLYRIGAETYSINYSQEADGKILEFNRLMMRIADEWDDGLAHYKIKPSGILP